METRPRSMAFCSLLWRSERRGYRAMMAKKSSRLRTARSFSSLATMVAVRMRVSSNRHASPNQAPASMTRELEFGVLLSDSLMLMCRLDIVGELWNIAAMEARSPSVTERWMSMCRPSDLGPKNAVKRPCTTKTTSRTSWPSSATMSPGVLCIQTWACASSPTKDLFTPLKRGNWSTTSCRSASANSRCTVGVSSLKRSVSMEIWLLWCRRLRSECSTRDMSSSSTPRRRIKFSARATRRSSGSSNKGPMAWEVTETMVPKKTDAMSMAKIEKSLPIVPTGLMSP
mmetsp:Transcript_3989/g.10588  ORF Transcript_3989/g.10588 Transcript_3989/m.10588 type:complete len:285 (-) Transcript_3989:1021-1875(-)